jgi:hypothetical protein
VPGFVANDQQWTLTTGHRELFFAGKCLTAALDDELTARASGVQSLPQVFQFIVISWTVFVEPLLMSVVGPAGYWVRLP